jgi:hypothetical protein
MTERRSTGIASFIGDLKRSRAAAAPTEEGREADIVAVLEESREQARPESPPIQPRRESKKGPGRPVGKSSNPDYTQYSVKLRITTHDEAIENLRKRARRQGNSPNKIDFSDLVEELLAAWNRKQS